MLVNLHSPARQKSASPLDRGDRRGAGRQGDLCACVCVAACVRARLWCVRVSVRVCAYARDRRRFARARTPLVCASKRAAACHGRPDGRHRGLATPSAARRGDSARVLCVCVCLRVRARAHSLDGGRCVRAGRGHGRPPAAAIRRSSSPRSVTTCRAPTSIFDGNRLLVT